MGGQASLLDGPHKGTRPNKRNVTGSALGVINNKSQLSKTDLAARMDVVETSVWRESTLYLCQSQSPVWPFITTRSN